MLEKVTGCRDLAGTTVSNIANGGRLQFMEWAEDHNKIPDECIDSCKGQSAIDAAINWKLTLDLM